MHPKLVAARPDWSASGRTEQVGRPIVAPPLASPALCAASANSISCLTFPRTNTTSGSKGAPVSGAYSATPKAPCRRGIQIGRASCRERGEDRVGGGYVEEEQ